MKPQLDCELCRKGHEIGWFSYTFDHLLFRLFPNKWFALKNPGKVPTIFHQLRSAGTPTMKDVMAYHARYKTPGIEVPTRTNPTGPTGSYERHGA